jgi:hypothetical protein
VEATLETVEPYIVDELPILSIIDQASAYIGFTHPHTTKRFEILDLLEARMLYHILESKIDLSSCIEILYDFSLKQVGSKVLVETLFN